MTRVFAPCLVNDFILKKTPGGRAEDTQAGGIIDNLTVVPGDVLYPFLNEVQDTFALF